MLYAQVADSRGLVFLRLGEYDKSIGDYDASLKINAKDAWSLYGRGIDEVREHKTAEGQADMAQARRSGRWSPTNSRDAESHPREHET
jgi:hypothetical protein